VTGRRKGVVAGEKKEHMKSIQMAEWCRYSTPGEGELGRLGPVFSVFWMAFPSLTHALVGKGVIDYGFFLTALPCEQKTPSCALDP